MRKKAQQSNDCVVQWLVAPVVFCALAVTIPAAASGVSDVSANKLALEAYCSEARHESAALANGSASYRDVIKWASMRAMVEYPDVCTDMTTWEAKIGAILDQYGDEALPELCSEDPDGVRPLDTPNLHDNNQPGPG
ncbi:MAG TPA: hypothetical protein VJ728_17220 [Candidatus Binataceae bacterium]|nr:hypothetical protein [Candidatus Binataceae bacterium]